MTAPGDPMELVIRASQDMRREAVEFRAKFDVFIGKLDDVIRQGRESAEEGP